MQHVVGLCSVLISVKANHLLMLEASHDRSYVGLFNFRSFAGLF